MNFVRLPRGTFYMGWDGENRGVRTEITHEFEIAMHEVTHGQWKAIMGKNRGSFTRGGAEAEALKQISDEELTLFPVENVSWHDAQEFIAKLNEKEQGRGWLYRLPSEVEWEYACRGGAESEEECSHHFYFAEPTDDLSSDRANFNGQQPFGQAPKGVSLAHPSRVGSYPPNKLGVCDMHGNVWEWCSDRVSEYPIGGSSVAAAGIMAAPPVGQRSVTGARSWNGTTTTVSVWLGFPPKSQLNRATNAEAGFRSCTTGIRSSFP